MQESLEGLTRAALLERCKARGLKATGWKKERMIAELGGTVPDVTVVGDATPEAGSPVEGPHSPDELEPAPADALAGRRIPSGWCISNQHADGRPYTLGGTPCPRDDCSCWCHAPADPQNALDNRVRPRTTPNTEEQ